MPKKTTTKQDFIDAGFPVIDGSTENALLTFLQTHYPQVIQDGEVKLDELKTALGLPIDEKVNGYGLNFIGRNVAKAKYAQETQKVLKINKKQSKNFDTTGNLVLRGDNLDSLKILKNYYGGKIKMIYIDPPYNTDSDNFVYPDKFDKEEAEVLGLANLSDDDMERLEFSFGNKKSHNGWLAFMYPRLRLARELLSKDGVIFISIDDNEQANLKLLCDEVFGEGNFVIQITWRRTDNQSNIGNVARVKEYILCYAKSNSSKFLEKLSLSEKALNEYRYEDVNGKFRRRILLDKTRGRHSYSVTTKSGNALNGPWMISKDAFAKLESENGIYWTSGGDEQPYGKIYLAESTGQIPNDFWGIEFGTNQRGSQEVEELFQNRVFDFPKPTSLLKALLTIGINGNDSFILDFFAGSGTTGQTVMQLNAEDGGNRRFILCQIDEPIEKKHAAYEFCTKHKLPPVISSITIERLNRAGEKIRSGNALHAKTADIGYKVLELTDAPRLEADDDLLVTFIDNESLTAQDRLTNLIFRVGVDDPTLIPEEIVKDSLYRIATRYYIVHSVKLDGEKNRMKLKEALIQGEHIYVDGWTATLNTTLQDMRGKGKDKEKMQIVY